MRRATIASIRAHIPRLVAVSLAIILAVAFMSATLILNSSMKATLRESIGQQYARADLVLSDGSSYGAGAVVTQDTEAKIAAVDGVEGIYIPLVSGISLLQDDGEVGLQVEALAPEEFRTTTLKSGSFPATDTEAAVDESTAKQHNLAIGDVISTRFDRYSENTEEFTPITSTLTIVGITNASKNPAAFSSGGLTVTSAFISALDPNMYGTSYGVTQVALAAGADASAVAASIDAVLPDGGEAITPDAFVSLTLASLTGGADLLTVVLMVFVGIALLVCALVIANTFAVLVSQRTRELALLRCLGADARQVYRSVLFEAVVVAVVASVLGVLVAIGLMSGLLAVFGPLLGSAAGLAVLSVDASALIWPIVAGIVVTLVAAMGPARQATRVAPLQAMRPVDALEAGVRAGKGRFAVGLVLVVVGGALLVFSSVMPTLIGPSGNGSEAILGFFGAFVGSAVSVVGVIMLAVFYVPAVIRGIGRLTGRFFGVSGRLATLNSVRNPRRTAATASALIIGVGLVATILTAGQVARATLVNELGEREPIDLSVSTGYVGVDSSVDASVNASAGSSVDTGYAPLTSADVTALGGIDGVDLVVPALSADLGSASLSGSSEESTSGSADDWGYSPPWQAISVSPEAYASVARASESAQLRDGVALVSSEIAGKKLTLTGVDGTQTQFDTSRGSSDGVAIFTPSDFAKISSTTTPTIALLKLDDGLTAAQILQVRDAISAIFPSASIGGASVERAVYEQIIDTLLLIVTGLLAVAIVIALIGVSNTLSLSVIERTRENALLRALGLTRAQLRGMLATEAILMSGIAALIGTGLGILYGVLGAMSLFGAIGGIVVSVPWLSLLAVVVVAALAGLLASVGPSRRAARLTPIEGLATN